MEDASNGYDAVAGEYLEGRGTGGRIGASTVREWAKRLHAGAAVLDLGCGPGFPISQALVDAGCSLYGVDASPTMIAAFRRRFPEAPSACEAVEVSRFFDRTFDAVVAWGLIFLLSRDAQESLIGKVAGSLNPGGSFLFTAPAKPTEWLDSRTGVRSLSLGVESYKQLLEGAGLRLVGEESDEGHNHYYFTEKAPLSSSR